jgi:hypothetical protein
MIIGPFHRLRLRRVGSDNDTDTQLSLDARARSSTDSKTEDNDCTYVDLDQAPSSPRTPALADDGDQSDDEATQLQSQGQTVYQIYDRHLLKLEVTATDILNNQACYTGYNDFHSMTVHIPN